MKKQKRRLPADNGISVSCRMYTKEKVSAPVLNDILLILLSMLTAVSAVMTFATVLDFSVQPGVIIPATAGFCLLYGVLFSLIKRRRYFVFIGMAVVAVLALIIFGGSIIKGSVILYDQARQTLSDYMAWDDVIHTYQWQDSFISLTNGALALFSFLLCSVISYFTVVKQSFIATFLLTFPFFEIGGLFGAVPDRLYFGMMLASWTASLTVSRVANAKTKNKKANGKVKKDPTQGTKGKFAASAVVIAALTLCLFLSSSSILSSFGVARGDNVDVLRKDTKNFISDVYDYIIGEDNDGSLKEGKLLEVDDRRIKNRHYFTMKTLLAKVPPYVKLKGYTGSVYKNNRWGDLENYDKYAELFAEFEKGGYNVGSLKGAVLITNPACFDVSDPDSQPFNFAEIHLSDFRRQKKYVYETYYGSFGEEYTSNNDTSVSHKKGNGDYTYTAIFPSSYDASRLKQADLYKDGKFKALWDAYGEMVAKGYTSSEATAKVKELASSFEIQTKYQLVDKIRQYFKDEFKHSMNVNKSPKNKDFVENFLFETKRGYSTHFATAATVMLQSQGIPTRYVEGYFIPQKVFLESDKDGYGAVSVNVTDAYAHAWVEIYDKDLGWIPVEVTPGYWSGLFAEEMQQTDEPEKPEEEPEEEEPQEEAEPNPEEEGPEHIETDENVAGTGEEGGRWATPLWAKLLIALGILIILAVIAGIAAHYIYNSARRKKLYFKDPETSVNAGYKYFLSLAKYDGIDCNNIYAFKNFADRCCENSPSLNKDDMEKFMNVYLKNTYSREKATMEEARQSADFVYAYSQSIYRDLPKLKKFTYKFIKNL